MLFEVASHSFPYTVYEPSFSSILVISYFVLPTSISELIVPLEIRLLIFCASFVAAIYLRLSSVELRLELEDEEDIPLLEPVRTVRRSHPLIVRTIISNTQHIHGAFFIISPFRN